jgi:outer membrane biosynthesis protein TonB
VAKRESDISQIKKYLSGELDARAMHQLERRAQDDPFLMDAIEGYEKAGHDQQLNLNELTDRLHNRITQKNARIIPLRLIGIAASILLVCSIAGWWLLKNNSANTPKLALVIKPANKKTVTADTVISQPKAEVAAAKPIPHTVHSRQLNEERKAAAPVASSMTIPEAVATVKPIEPQSKDTTPLNEMVVMDYTAQQKKGRVAGVPVANNKSQITNVPTSKTLIKGNVTGKNDGLPVVGAAVRVSGTTKTTVTDANGNFALPADSGKVKLIVSYIGYNAQVVNVQDDNAVKIMLQPSSAALAEVTITGYSSQKKKDIAAANADVAKGDSSGQLSTEQKIGTTAPAHPKGGWGSFRKYLKKGAVSPDGKTGIVKLSFQVDANGNISNIKVLRGLDKETDQKATDLIIDGPAWLGSTSGQVEKVSLRVKFVK